MRGFTLIELMLVVTVIAILVLVALPAFQNYTMRAKVSEAFTQSDPVRMRIADLVQEGGDFPANNEAALLDPPEAYRGRYVAAVEVLENGVVRVSFADPSLAGRTVTFTPSATGPSVTWACASTLPRNLLPAACR